MTSAIIRAPSSSQRPPHSPSFLCDSPLPNVLFATENQEEQGRHLFFWKLSEVVSKQKEKPHPLGDGECFVPLVLETGIVLQSTTCPQWLHCRLKEVSLPAAHSPLPGWSELGSLMWNHELQETKLISFWDKVRLM